jgi:hypothetical protein
MQVYQWNRSAPFGSYMRQEGDMIGCQGTVSPDFVWEMHANQGSGISFHFPFFLVGWEIKVWVIGPFFPPVRCLCIPLCVGWPW